MTGEASFEEVFPFLRTKRHIISLVGAGGKTTLLYLLAENCRKRGFRTLVTTTTHIYQSIGKEQPENGIWISNEMEMRKQWDKGYFAIAGTETTGQKLRMLPEEQLKRYMEQADITLIEADGAKHLPCKVPNKTEPVLVDESDIVIGVVGLDAVGKPLNEACFRIEETAKLLGTGTLHTITEEDIVQILRSEHGTAKETQGRDYHILLNKCDNEERKKSGERILRLLKQQGMTQTVMARLK